MATPILRGRPTLIAGLRGAFSDSRVLAVIGQAVFLFLLIAAVAQVWTDMNGALASRNLVPSFTFLENRAGFAIAGAVNYTPDSSYWDAYLVGVNNTLTVVSAGLIGATVLGILAGIFLLSSNWLVRTITRVIVEILRNTPLLVQIFVVFFVFILALPEINNAITLPEAGIAVLPLRYIAYTIITLYALVSANRQTDWRRRARVWAFAGAVVALGEVAALIGWLPDTGLRFEVASVVVISNRGLVSPQLFTTARFAQWAIFIAIGVTVAVAAWIYYGRVTEQTGQPFPRLRYGLLAILGFALIGWWVVSATPAPATVPVTRNGETVLLSLEEARTQNLLSIDERLQYSQLPLEAALPERRGLRFATGSTLDQRYLALLVALVIYTAAFIAEIVRAGILAVPPGQIEAARAIGLNGSQMLQLVILPQALRVIIPPLGNQYLNLAKNSSLAFAIAYSDTYAVMYTVINQSGQSVTGILLIMLTYLIISLTIAALMNWVNGRFQLKTR